MKIKQIIYTKKLVAFPCEQEAAQLYHQFLKKYPEYDNDDTLMYIQVDEREYDFHGRGGGIERTLIIYKWRDETQQELDNRIKDRDYKIMYRFNEEFDKLFKSLKEWCKDIHEKESIEKIVNSVREYIDYCFKNNYIENKKIKLL